MIAYLTVLVGFAVVALLARFLERSWVAPATVWPLIWLLYTAAALPYLVEPQRIVPALLWILLNCGIFLAGAVLARGIRWRAADAILSRPSGERFPWLGPIVIALSAAGILSLLLEVRSIGFRPSDLLSFTAIARIAAAARAAFTFGEQTQGLFERVLLVLAYTGALFGGLYACVARAWHARAAAFVPLWAILFIGLVHGSRMGALFGGSFWLGAYLAGRLVATVDQPTVSTRLIFAGGGMALVLFVGMSAAVQFVRYFVGSQKTAALVIADPFGFLAAFAQWFEDAGVRTSAMTGGFYTFERIGRMLGVELPAVPAISVGFTSSNVYTVFRALIEDFGSVGSLAVVASVGFLGSLAHHRVVRGGTTWIAALALTYAFLFASVALSLFAYTGPAIGAALFAAYCAFVARPRGAWRAALVGLAPRPSTDRNGG